MGDITYLPWPPKIRFYTRGPPQSPVALSSAVESLSNIAILRTVLQNIPKIAFFFQLSNGDFVKKSYRGRNFL